MYWLFRRMIYNHDSNEDNYDHYFGGKQDEKIGNNSLEWNESGW